MSDAKIHGVGISDNSNEPRPHEADTSAQDTRKLAIDDALRWWSGPEAQSVYHSDRQAQLLAQEVIRLRKVCDAYHQAVITAALQISLGTR